MREYAMPLAQNALKTLSAKYNFTPKGPILIEIFPKHDDFAVRNLGLPGMIGALGACFGRVVTLDSPRARPPGSFSWQATLWHEMAHVITLQMSNQRVPRWLTEGDLGLRGDTGAARMGDARDGSAVCARAGAGQDAEARGSELRASRAPTRSGWPISRPRCSSITSSARMVAQKLQALVRSYAEGLEGNAAVEKTIGVSMDQLQASFDKAIDARFGALRAALRTLPGVLEPRGSRRREGARGDGGCRGTARAPRAANPGNYAAQLAYGQALAAAGDKAAFEPLEKAAALVPTATGDDSPHALMAKLAEQLGDSDRAMKEYQAVLARDHTTLGAARRLAALAERTLAEPVLSIAYDRVVAIDPFDPLGHSGLGRLALKHNQPETAVREFRAALAIGPADRASAHCDLAEAYLLANRPAEAKAQALAALEIAPSYDRAQELLLRAIKNASASGAGQ